MAKPEQHVRLQEILHTSKIGVMGNNLTWADFEIREEGCFCFIIHSKYWCAYFQVRNDNVRKRQFFFYA